MKRIALIGAATYALIAALTTSIPDVILVQTKEEKKHQERLAAGFDLLPTMNVPRYFAPTAPRPIYIPKRKKFKGYQRQQKR